VLDTSACEIYVHYRCIAISVVKDVGRGNGGVSAGVGIPMRWHESES
jgi:hypothetical protein